MNPGVNLALFFSSSKGKEQSINIFLPLTSNISCVTFSLARNYKNQFAFFPSMEIKISKEIFHSRRKEKSNVQYI